MIVLAADDAPPDRVAALEAAGVEVIPLRGGPPERIRAGLRALGSRGIQSLLVEGGAELAGAMVEAGAVDRVAWFLAPLLIGGREAPSAIGGHGPPALGAAPRLGGAHVRAGGQRPAGHRAPAAAGGHGVGVFTGLIEEAGVVAEVRPGGGGGAPDDLGRRRAGGALGGRLGGRQRGLPDRGGGDRRRVRGGLRGGDPARAPRSAPSAPATG